MRACVRLWVGVAGVLLVGAGEASAKLSCAAQSACPDPSVVADVRAAVDDACPCDDASSAKRWKKCWKPVVKARAVAIGKADFPKSCRKDVLRALANSTCGRPDATLCRSVSKRGGEVCRVTKAARCNDPYDFGGFPSCADACDDLVAVPFPTTRELSTADLSSLEPDPGDGTLHFPVAPAALSDVHVGTIIVAGVGPSTPTGLLRAVLAVERDGDSLTLRTGQAPIQLAYRTLHVRFVRRAVLPAPAAAAARSSSRLPVARDEAIDVTQPFDFLLFDGDGDASTTNDQIAIDGTIGGGFDYEFGLDVDWDAIDSLPDFVWSCLVSFANVLTGGEPSCSIDDLLPEAKASFVVFPEVRADANVHGAAILNYEKELDLASETLTPIVVGPLVFVPVADVTARLEGGASGAFSTGIHGSALFKTSVTVSSKQTQMPRFAPPTLVRTDFGPNDTTVTLHARAKVGVGARLNVLLFGVTGPYATALGYGSLDADVFQDPCWSLHAGIDADLGIRVTSPALPLIGQVVLVDWRAPTVNPLDVELSTGACLAPPDESTLPPGSGPDAMRLANPTYTPWARSYSSPVEGAYAASPGNGVLFSDLERTIDGRYVRSGYGVLTLTKINDDGGLVWAHNLATGGGAPLPPTRAASASDGTILVASRSITPAIVLSRVTQDGTVVDAYGYDVPLETCNVDLTALAADDAGGAWIVGSCIGQPKSFVLHAHGSSATFHLIGDAPSLRLNVAERVGNDLFLAGASRDSGDPLVAMRLRADGTIAWSKRYDGCLEAPDAIPSAAIVGDQEDVTIAGSGGAQHNGIVVRLLADGSVGFATFPGFGFGAGSVFLLDSIAELPTTGYVAAGSTVQFTGTEPENVPSAALVGLDAAGHVLWANRYTFGAAGSYDASGHVAVRLSDDGGALATALVADPLNPLGGRLWAWKPFAKDGDIPFASGAATLSALDVADLPCAFTASDQPFVLTAVPIAAARVDVTSAPAPLTTAQQTAE